MRIRGEKKKNQKGGGGIFFRVILKYTEYSKDYDAKTKYWE